MLSAKDTIKKRILNSKNSSKFWSLSDFKDINTKSSNIARVLSDLNKQKIIARAGKGLYYIPRETILGPVPPDPEALALTKVRKKASFAFISGLSGYNKIGLTTQVPNVITIACDHNMRNTDRFKFIKRNKPTSGTEIERIILDAIRDIKIIPDTTPEKTINRIKNLISSGKVDINDLVKSALKEPPVVKALVGALGQELNVDKALLNKLESQINPLTSFSLGLKDTLKYSGKWRIK